LIIASATSKSAMTPSRSGRIAWMLPGCAAQHHLGFLADRQNLALAALGGESHHRRLVQDDATTLDVDQRVGRAEVDPHVGREKPNDARQHSLSLCNCWENPPCDSVPKPTAEVRSV
jgi:hypothetical protein